MSNTSQLRKQHSLLNKFTEVTFMNKVYNLLVISKFFLSLHIASTALAGFLLFSNQIKGTSFLIFFSVLMVSCGAGLLNNIFDSSYDRNFLRTKSRAIPAGNIRKKTAFFYSLCFMGTGFILISRFRSFEPLVLILLSVLCYNFIYTPLKKRSTTAILPGTICGMLPPLIGYSAAGGQITDTSPMLFSLPIYLFFELFIKKTAHYRHSFVIMNVSILIITLTVIFSNI